MLYKKYFFCLLAFSPLLFSATCDKQAPRQSCDGVICTMEFAMVTVAVKDQNGNTVPLDSTITRNKSGLMVSNSNQSSPAGDGRYVVADDSYQKALALRSEEVIFTGYKSGQKVIEQNFIISADCCHISKVSGPDILTIK